MILQIIEIKSLFFQTESNITTLDIVDTAIKIGLGALIAGVTTYIVTPYKHQSDVEKERLARRQTILEEVARQAEELNHAYLLFAGKLLNKNNRLRNEQEWLSTDIETMNSTINKLMEAFKETTSAGSKLLLLGLQEAYDGLTAFGTHIYNFYDAFCDSDLDDNSILSDKEKFRAIRKTFYATLSKQYNKNL